MRTPAFVLKSVIALGQFPNLQTTVGFNDFIRGQNLPPSVQTIAGPDYFFGVFPARGHWELHGGFLDQRCVSSVFSSVAGPVSILLDHPVSDISCETVFELFARHPMALPEFSSPNSAHLEEVVELLRAQPFLESDLSLEDYVVTAIEKKFYIALRNAEDRLTFICLWIPQETFDRGIWLWSDLPFADSMSWFLRSHRTGRKSLTWIRSGNSTSASFHRLAGYVPTGGRRFLYHRRFP